MFLKKICVRFEYRENHIYFRFENVQKMKKKNVCDTCVISNIIIRYFFIIDVISKNQTFFVESTFELINFIRSTFFANNYATYIFQKSTFLLIF